MVLNGLALEVASNRLSNVGIVVVKGDDIILLIT